jgi:hypothetical protein
MAGVILALLMGLGVARADTSGFMDAFASTNWSFQLQSGTGYFNNANTELDLEGAVSTESVTMALWGAGWRSAAPWSSIGST